MKSILHIGLLVMAFTFLTGCQIGYIIKSGYEQAKILSKRVEIQKALQDPTLTEEEKQKLRLAEEVKVFTETRLGLAKTKNYTTFVKLDRPYVSYVLNASPKYKLEPYLWSFPFMGSFPYKGFFSEAEAKAEAQSMKDAGYDTFVRGVSAYSTLGYFKDPILSSMLNYDEPTLVNTLIHETVHATLFIKNSADFNERLAVFLANKGTELFYLEKETASSAHLKQIKEENEDETLFSEFITREMNEIKLWYADESHHQNDKKLQKFTEVREHFNTQVKPHLKSKSYGYFQKLDLNNAAFLSFAIYVADLNDFEKAYELNGKDFQKTLEFFRRYEGLEKPEAKLKSDLGRLE